MKRKKLVTLIGSLCLMLALAAMPFLTACPAPEETPTPTEETPTPTPTTLEPITLKASTIGGPGHGARTEMEHFIAAVEERSEGRIKFDFYPASALFTLKENFDACRTGAVDLAHIAYVYEPDRLGALGAVGVMAGNFHHDKLIEHYRDPGGFLDWASTYTEKWNLKLLATTLYATGYELNSRMPIHKLEDFKGKIIKAPGALNRALELMGAEPIYMSMDAVYEALQRGTIDAQMSTLDTIVVQQWYEVGKYITIPRLVTSTIGMVMNMDRYNGLDPAYRKIIDDSVLQMHEEVKYLGVEKYKRYAREMEENPNVDFYVVPDDELARWMKAIEPQWDELQAKFGDEWTRFMEIRRDLW